MEPETRRRRRGPCHGKDDNDVHNATRHAVETNGQTDENVIYVVVVVNAGIFSLADLDATA